jgi:hypothetical protein
MTAEPEDRSVPVGIRRELKPFGGVNGQVAWEKAKLEALLTESRQYCFDHGFLTSKDLDDEELVAGRCRDRNGRIPKVHGKTELIPRHLYDEMVAEHELRYKQKLRERLDQMLDIMTDIAEDDTVEPRDRFEAAKYIFERTAGKTPENVTVSVKLAPWEELLNQVTGIAPMTRSEHLRLQAGIVDAEVVEDGEEKEQEAPPYGEERDTGADATVRQSAPDAVPAGEPTDASTGYMSAAEEYWTEGDIPKPGDPPKEPYQDEPELNYGRRADEKRSYSEQARDAQSLAKRRKEAKEKIRNATKQRKIARALGADAIKDEITGVELSEDGKLKFEQG